MNTVIQRRLPILAAAISLVAAVVVARHWVLCVLGEWMSRRHLVYSLSTPVSGWAEWPAAATRPESLRADAGLSLAMVFAWALSVWWAALVADKIGRTLWLLVSVVMAVAFCGAGDAWAGPAVLFGVALMRFALEVKWKPVTLAALLAAVPGVGLAVIWQTSRPEAVTQSAIIAWWLHGAVVIGASAAVWRWGRGRRVMPATGALYAAGLAALVYAGMGYNSPSAAWRARYEAVMRWCEPGEDRALRAALSGYRLSEGEASVQRLDSAEASTRWADFPAVQCRAQARAGAISPEVLWLSTDALLYGPRDESRVTFDLHWLDFKSVVPVNFYHWPRRLMIQVPLEAADWRAITPGGVGVSRQATLAGLAALEMRGGESAPWAAEATGALKFDAGVYPQAAAAFRRALRRRAWNAPIWWALAKAEAMQHDGGGRAAEALSRALMQDPRMLFSPELEREPLKRVAAPALAALDQAIISGVKDLGANRERVVRYRHWRRLWDDADGRIAAFLDRLGAEVPKTETVACLRRRLAETMRGREPAKVGAYFASAFALVCDRHITLGGSHTLFAMCEQGGSVWANPNGPHRLRWRAMSVNWCGLAPEGGIGASFVVMEENAIARLLCYACESP